MIPITGTERIDQYKIENRLITIQFWKANWLSALPTIWHKPI